MIRSLHKENKAEPLYNSHTFVAAGQLEAAIHILKALNLLVRFVLELCMLAAAGFWGFKTGSGWVMKVFLGIGLPSLVAAGWWLAWKLSGLPRLALELGLLGSGAVALFASNLPGVAWAYLAILVINKALMIAWKQEYKSQRS